MSGSVKWLDNPGFWQEIKRRNLRGVKSVDAEFIGGDMAATLSNSPARTGNRYWVRKGRLIPVSSGKVRGKSGRMRNRRGITGKTRVHISSKAGEPLALLSGQFRQSRGSLLNRKGGPKSADIGVLWGASQDYVSWEFRSPDGDESKARPMFAPTFEANLAKYQAIYGAAFKGGA